MGHRKFWRYLIKTFLLTYSFESIWSHTVLIGILFKYSFEAISINQLCILSSIASTAQYMSEVFECNTTDSQEIVDCLRAIEGKELDRTLKQASRRDGVLLQFGTFEDTLADRVFVDQVR